MGGGALHPRTIEYKSIPTGDVEKLVESLNQINFGKRETLAYDDEIKQDDKRQIDLAILKGLGFDLKTSETLEELCRDYIELVKDRLVKSGKSPSSKGNKEKASEEMDEGAKD